MDIALRYKPQHNAADIVLHGNDLLRDDGLETSVILSLFCDARAGDDDIIPDGTNNRRGWWAGELGSKLWLLSREKEQGAVLLRAREYALEALQWLIDDGVASAIEAQAEFVGNAVLALRIEIVRISDPDSRWQRVWEVYLNG